VKEIWFRLLSLFWVDGYVLKAWSTFKFAKAANKAHFQLYSPFDGKSNIMKRKAISLWAILICSLPFFIACTEKPKAEMLFFNARIYTLDHQFTIAEAMAISEGKIVAVGNTESLKKTWKFQEEINLNQQPIYPGFIDAHCHFVGFANTLSQVNLMGCRSEAEAVARCKAFFEKHQPKFILGRGWDQNLWSRKVFPTAASLDSVFPDIPVILRRVDGHASWVNSHAIRAGNVDCSDAVIGGRILCADGIPTGVFIDNAMDLIPTPAGDKAQLIRSLLEAEKQLFSFGLTTLDDAGLSLKMILLLDSLQQAGIMKMRVYAMASDDDANWTYFSKNGRIKTDHLNVRSFKVYGDGALGSRGASLLKPYSDAPEESGFLLADSAYFANAANRCLSMGFQMNTHAIGDAANRTMLRIYENATKNSTGLRWRIEHAQVVAPEDFAMFSNENILPSVQPTHATSDMYWAGSRLGPDRLPFAYAFNRLYKQAGLIALGTDFPVEDISPFKTFYAAVARKDSAGFPDNGFFPEEALSREVTIRGMTIMAAYANFEEKEKGSLEVGKFADFIILDRDIMEVPEHELLGAKVIQTWLGGLQVFALNP